MSSTNAKSPPAGKKGSKGILTTTRPPRGVPKGYKQPKTIEKEAARAALRQIVLEHMQELVGAQLANAKGISHFFLRDKAGQFVKIEDPKLIAQALNSGDEGSYYYIFTKDPSIQAFTDLMNRAIDKPAEQEQQHEHKGTIVLKHELGE